MMSPKPIRDSKMISSARKMRKDAVASVKTAAAGLSKAKKRQPKEDFNQAAFRAIQETIRISES